MLQVDSARDTMSLPQVNGENGDDSAAGAAKEAARRGREALGSIQVSHVRNSLNFDFGL